MYRWCVISCKDIANYISMSVVTRINKPRLPNVYCDWYLDGNMYKRTVPIKQRVLTRIMPLTAYSNNNGDVKIAGRETETKQSPLGG